MNFRNKSVSLQNVFLSKILNNSLFPHLTSVRSNSSIRARLGLTFSTLLYFLPQLGVIVCWNAGKVCCFVAIGVGETSCWQGISFSTHRISFKNYSYFKSIIC